MQSSDFAQHGSFWDVLSLVPALCVVSLAGVFLLLSEQEARRPVLKIPVAARSMTSQTPLGVPFPNLTLYIVPSQEKADEVRSIEDVALKIADEAGVLTNHRYVIIVATTPDEVAAAQVEAKEWRLAGYGEQAVDIANLTPFQGQNVP